MTPRRRKGTPPPYLRHKATGQAYCTIDGRRRYLGKHGSAESRRRYKEEVRRWEEGQRQKGGFKVLPGCTVAELIAAYMDHAARHYRDEDGRPTSEYEGVRRPLTRLRETHGPRRADDFRARDLRAMQAAWVESGTLSRTSVNAYVQRVRRCFRWGVEHELLEPSVLTGLEAVRDLAAGRTEAREAVPVAPVPEENVRAVLPHLTRQVAALVLLQHTIGCRPGEVCRMRGCELDRSGVVHLGKRTVQLPGDVWVWQPGRHKARHRKKQLVYLLGPRARQILTPWLVEDPEAYLFRPADALAEVARASTAARKRKRSVARRRPDYSRARPYYPTGSYRTAVAVACDRAGIPRWHPHQLRHNVATRYDAAAGLEMSAIILGHSRLATTELYLERDLTRAAEVVERLG